MNFLLCWHKKTARRHPQGDTGQFMYWIIGIVELRVWEGERELMTLG